MRQLSGLALGIALAVSGCAAPTVAQLGAADYGAPPADYDKTIRQYFDATLKDPGSVQYRNETTPEKGYVQDGPIYGGAVHYGWLVRIDVNAKNSYGGYTGFKPYGFVFRGEKIISSDLPPSE